MSHVPTEQVLQTQFSLWSQSHPGLTLNKLTLAQLQEFVTAPLSEGGLGLLPTQFDSAYAITDVIYGFQKFSSGNLFGVIS